MHDIRIINPFLPTPKVIRLATSIEPGQTAHACSLTRLYTVGLPTSSTYLDIPKIDNGKFHKWKVDYSI